MSDVTWGIERRDEPVRWRTCVCMYGQEQGDVAGMPGTEDASKVDSRKERKMQDGRRRKRLLVGAEPVDIAVETPEHGAKVLVGLIGEAMDAVVLLKVVMAGKVLAAAFERALERCKVLAVSHWHSFSLAEEDARFSPVWMERTCRLRCSLRLKHLPQAGTLHMKIFLGLPVLVVPA